MALADAASSRLDELKNMSSGMPEQAPADNGPQSMIDEAVSLLEQASATPGFEGLKDIITQLQTVSPKVDEAVAPTSGTTSTPAGAGQI